MRKLTQSGRGHVNKTQIALAEAKEALRIIIREMRALAKEDREAGDLKASNAAMRLEGVAHTAIGVLTQGHADASDALAETKEDGGDIVVMGGGGR